MSLYEEINHQLKKIPEIEGKIQCLQSSLDRQTDALEDKLDTLVTGNARISEKLLTIQLLQDRNTDDLEEHMRRTVANEKRLDEIEKLKYIITGALFFAALLSQSLRDVLLSIVSQIKG